MKSKWRRDAVVWDGGNVMEAPTISRPRLSTEMQGVRDNLLMMGKHPRLVCRILRDEYGIETNWKAHASARNKMIREGKLKP